MSKKFKIKLLISSAATDPKGASSGSFRVQRGGSWGYYADRCRSAYRCIRDDPSDANAYLGFRLSIILPE